MKVSYRSDFFFGYLLVTLFVKNKFQQTEMSVFLSIV